MLMSGLGELALIDGSGMRVPHAGHLVIRDSIKFVIGDRGSLGNEFVEADSLVTVFQFLNGNRIGRVVHKHIRVGTNIGQMDDVILRQGRCIGNPVQPASFEEAAQALDEFPGPYLRKYPFTEALRHSYHTGEDA